MIRRLNHELVLSLLPDRNPWGHKGNFGKLLLLCGSRGYTGAAFFAAMGALRAGAGLVFLGVPESISGIEAVKLNEPVIFPLPDAGGRLSADAVPEILTRLPPMDAVLVGPGLGQSEGTLAVVRAVLEKAECPVVVDADGIKFLSAHRDLLRGRKSPTILTPHDGEFARLGGVIGEDRMAAAAALAEELGCVVLLKGHETCITDGTDGYLNPTGNPGMAVGGSGAVLAGGLKAALGASPRLRGVAPRRGGGPVRGGAGAVRNAAHGHAQRPSATYEIRRGFFEKNRGGRGGACISHRMFRRVKGDAAGA